MTRKIIGVASAQSKPLPEKCCGKCAYAKTVPPMPPNLAQALQCKKNPPTAIAMGDQMTGQILFVGVWPPVPPEESCSQFEPAPPPLAG